MTSRALPDIITGVRAGAAAIAAAPAHRRAYLPKEFAQLCAVHPATAYRWIQAGLVKVEIRAGFKVISRREANRFAREGPRPHGARP